MLPETFTPRYLRQLELLKIRTQRAFLGTRQGGHLSLKRGHGIEFSDYRKYELGDNPRHIDWGVYGRSERLYVKRFQEEQDLPVLLVVDNTRSMHEPELGRKWKMAKEVCLSLAYVALMQHDTVRLCVPGSFVSPSYYGGRAIHQISQDLEKLSPASEDDFLFGIRQGLSTFRFPGVAIFLSDFLMPLETVETMMNMLRAKNLDITALQVLGRSDVTPLPDTQDAIVIDSETNEEIELRFDASVRDEYEHLLSRHIDTLRTFLSQAGIAFDQVIADEDLAVFMLDSLTKKGLLQ
ncbi:MAG: DUF58 domain-containing protein [Bdellovibrionales bacterium]|nr:DUF58 domain-containing protein [Bdellovibrionales bacterium]